MQCRREGCIRDAKQVYLVPTDEWCSRQCYELDMETDTK